MFTQTLSSIGAPQTKNEKLARHAEEWFTTGETSGGSHITQLFELCCVSDRANIAQLAIAYPAEVRAWSDQAREGERLYLDGLAAAQANA